MMPNWLATVFRDAIPQTGLRSAVKWSEKNVKLIGSARAEQFNSSLTPWTREPLEKACSGECSHVTLVKPVQSGGSAAGECALCVWIGTESGGDIQYNWENDDKAGQRWDKRIEKILLACKAVMARAPVMERHAGKWKKCQVIFPHCNLTVQGVFTTTNLDSDTIRFQLNEEIHNWEPGLLQKAYNRTTAVWNSIVFNISNASIKDDQLHQALKTGTDQQWEVLCPGCRSYHALRTKWEDDKPQLGGIRYSSKDAKTEDGKYDYNKLAETIYYQMPCGYTFNDDPILRRELSLSGRYGPPRNKGALLRKPSYSLDAASVDYIPWVNLIQEKHEALRAMAFGDPEPYIHYVQERECCFWDPEDRPIVGRVTVVKNLTKRDGLPNRVCRFGSLDRQRGKVGAGEFPHWWAIIRDVDALGNSRLVYEGKSLTDEDAADVMARHKVEPTCVAVDSGDDTVHTYQFCLKHGFNAIKGADEPGFSHPGSGRKIFSIEKPLHTMMNLPPTKEDPLKEPLFWHYSKSGIRERLRWLRSATEIKWEVPADVSKEYKEHMEAEEERERKGRTGETIVEWIQVKRRNDLFVCECYIAMLMDMAGMIGQWTSTK